MFNSKPKPGLIIEVGTERYDAYIHPGNYRHYWLAAVLKMVCGGVSNTVTPGLYEFNAHRKGLALQVSLNPHNKTEN